jgi:hypothetical protein
LAAAYQQAMGLPRVTVDSVRSRLPKRSPVGIGAIIAGTLNQDPATLNTDWFGTMLMHGLLLWHKRGIWEVRPFAQAWLDHHLQRTEVAPYSGNRSRPVAAGGIPITTYVGHYGLSSPCYEMALQFGDRRAREICLDIARIILHQSARNRFGMVAHDDDAEFAIPDSCYFVVTALMIAYRLDPQAGQIFRDQALYQLRMYTDRFLIKETGLAKTVLLKEGLGQTYWTRATGWLLWAITGVLRHLEPSHPDFGGIIEDLKALAGGIARVQDSKGGLRVLLDDPSTPLETTGTAMCALGLHESVRCGWLPSLFAGAAGRAWDFVQRNITDAGEIRQAYTGWAVPAEKRVVSIDERKMGWIPGFILFVANEMGGS